MAAVSCSDDAETVKLEGVTLAPTTVSMLPAETTQLTLTVQPEKADYDAVLWTSDNEAVATVDEQGLVTAVGAGTANIRVEVKEFSASCAVTVFAGNKLADNAQVGDFYLADGSLLDRETDAATITSANVIGIVFTTDVTRMGEAEKEALRAKGVEPHGLVIATRTPRQVTDLFYWYMTPDYNGSRDESEIGLPKLWDNFEEGEGKEHETYALVNNDLEGYKYNMAIRTERKADFEAGYYGAIKAAADFEIEVPAPAASTGWYLPSAGQWFDVLRNLAGVELSDTESSFFLIDDYGNFSWMNKGRVNDILNECMAHVADNMKTPYASLGNQDQYWTSSTVSDDQARVIMFDNASFVYSWWYRKYFQWSVRTVLGF